MNSILTKRHDFLVEHVARQLKRRFYDDVRARTAGFRVPSKVLCDASGQEVVPDVTMVAGGEKLNVLEVETLDTLRGDEIEEKWRILAQHAAKGGGRFWVVVPKEIRDTALDRLRASGVEGKLWEVEEASA